MVLRAPWRGTAIAVRERREEKNSPEQRAISSKEQYRANAEPTTSAGGTKMLWQKATTTYTRTATSSPSEESTSGMHSAHEVSAEWDSADKIIPLFYLSEGSQVWIWRAIFQDFPPCKFKSKWLYTGASLTPPSCQGWFKISEREVSRAGFLNRLFSLHCSMAQCSVISRSLNFQHWYVPCVLVGFHLVLGLVKRTSWWWSLGGHQLSVTALME